jgi:hypothetical protein
MNQAVKNAQQGTIPPYKPKGKAVKINMPPMFPEIKYLIESLSSYDASSSKKEKKRKSFSCDTPDFSYNAALEEITQFSSYYDLNDVIPTTNKNKASANYNSSD